MNKKNLLYIFLFYLICFSANSQLVTSQLNRYAASFSVKSFPASPLLVSNFDSSLNHFRDVDTGFFGNTILSAQFRFPLYTKKLEPDEKGRIEMFGVNASAGAGLQVLNLSWLKNVTNIINANFLLSAYHYDGEKSLWTGSAGLFASNDYYSIGNPVPRFVGSLIYNRLTSQRISYNAGLLYNYYFGKGSLYPLLGVRFSIWKKGLFILQYPNQLAYLHNINNSTSVKLFLRPAGSVATMDNRFRDLNSSINQVVLRNPQTELGISFRKILKGKFLFFAETGILGGRNLYISLRSSGDDTYDYTKVKIQDSYFVNAGFVFYKNRHKRRINDQMPAILPEDWSTLDF